MVDAWKAGLMYSLFNLLMLQVPVHVFNKVVLEKVPVHVLVHVFSQCLREYSALNYVSLEFYRSAIVFLYSLGLLLLETPKHTNYYKALHHDITFFTLICLFYNSLRY